MNLTVNIYDDEIRRKIARISSVATMCKLNQYMGEVVLEHTKDFLDDMASTRHKCADRLGAKHSKFLEHASGRLAGSKRNQKTDLEDVSEKSATIAIKNTPGLSRAWQDLRISAKRAKALTIPIDRISHDKSVADLRWEGHKIFHPKGTNILAESRGKGKKATIRPLYALVRSVTVPKDEGLLPKPQTIREWGTKAMGTFFEEEELLS